MQKWLKIHPSDNVYVALQNLEQGELSNPGNGDVLELPEIIPAKHKCLVRPPAKGKAASGATLILFTTGPGTPTGNTVCPTIKLSGNSALAARMPDIIDINSGPVIEGTKSIKEMGEKIMEYCISAASGMITPKAVLLNQDDFIPWKHGVSL